MFLSYLLPNHFEGTEPKMHLSRSNDVISKMGKPIDANFDGLKARDYDF
jgi:hypothetical protein